jgi:hypothetical protein
MEACVARQNSHVEVGNINCVVYESVNSMLMQRLGWEPPLLMFS